MLETRLRSIREALEEVLAEDEDMAHMFLTRFQRKPQLWDQMAEEGLYAEHEEAELILESYLEDVDSLTNATQLLRQDLEASEVCPWIPPESFISTKANRHSDE